MDNISKLDKFDPAKLAVLYYFGDLQYWKLPAIAIEALSNGYDGIALRKLAGWTNPIGSDFHPQDAELAFKEMGINSITKDEARLILAAESAAKALNGTSNVFDEATHIRIYLCELNAPPPELDRIVNLSKESKRGAKSSWESLENQLRTAMSDFLKSRT
jgi:hypothetical protein